MTVYYSHTTKEDLLNPLETLYPSSPIALSKPDIIDPFEELRAVDREQWRQVLSHRPLLAF